MQNASGIVAHDHDAAVDVPIANIGIQHREKEV